MKTTTILTCNNLTEAHLIKGRLLNEGIDCFLTNEQFTNLMPLYNNMLGSGIQVVVSEDDVDRARELLKDKLQPEPIAMKCPYCCSEDIGLGLGKHRGLKIFNMIIAVLSFIPLGNLKPTYYCKTCKREIG